MLKILTWNINGIRALKIPLKEQLDNLNADIICLQETKVTRDQFDEATAIVDGYNSYFSFSRVKSGYSGVATFVRDSAVPVRAEEGLSSVTLPGSVVDKADCIGCYAREDEFTSEELTKLDSEGRCVITEHKIVNEAGDQQSLVIINVYCPRAEPGNVDRLRYKLSFYRLLQLRSRAILDAGRHVIVLGDINTSHKRIDHCSPDDDEEFYANPGRQWMDGFLIPCESDMHKNDFRKFVDTYRWLHPDQLNAFTNWCTLTGARATNYGCRLDYAMADLGMLPYLSACHIMADVEGSDHCPVKTEFNCRCIAAAKCPPLCTKYLPQFAGRQQKLFAFLTRRHSDDSQKNSSQSDDVLNEAKSQPASQCVGNASTFGSASACDSDQCSREAVSPDVDWSNTYDEEHNFECFERSSGTDFRQGASAFSACKRMALNVKSSKSKKMKEDMTNSKQSSLLSFFGKPKSLDQNIEKSKQVAVQDTSVLPSCTKNTQLKPSSGEATSSLNSAVPEDTTKLPEVNVQAWKGLLKGPPQTPLCRGHKEPCLLRTVRKDGPNKGKQFWVCNRPEGHKNNPDARCDYFVWVKKQ